MDPKHITRTMGSDTFRQGGAENNSNRAKTNNAIMQIACGHDLGASAADRQWRPGTVKTTHVDGREFFSPAKAAP